jgi:hypothetical protein
MEQRLTYFKKDRGGHILYSNTSKTIKFEIEIGGGDGVIIIYIPTKQIWETETKTDILCRQEVLDFLCKQVIKDQAPNCYCVIKDDCIEVIRK